MCSGNSQVTLRTAGLGLLAVTLSSTAAPVAQATRVSCTVTSAGSTNIDSVPGFANALVELAEFSCNGVGAGTVPINERVTGVASAMAEAVAEVIGQCTGEGTAMATLSGLSRAEARAEAVGTASARILATSEACELCTAALDSFSTAVETVTATAVAEASIAAEFIFQEGDDQTFTVNDVQRTVEENIVELLGTVTGEIHTNAVDGCSANAVTLGQAGASFATCDVAISADDILEEVDAVADAGVAVQALACEGNGNEAEIRLIARDVAVAVAKGVVQADSFCESSGGPGTVSCGLSSGTITAVASASATAFSNAMADAMGPDCGCDLSVSLSAQEVEDIMAVASTSALAQTCAEGNEVSVKESDFQIVVEEAMAVAISEAIANAVSGEACNVGVIACVDAAECVPHSAQCAGGAINGILACCNAEDVCASVPDSPTFQCMDRATVDTMAAAEVLECS